MTDLTKLSATKLRAVIKERDLLHMINVNAFIDSGRGHMRGSEIREAAKGSGLLNLTVMARAWCETRDALTEVYDEESRRIRYHGSDKPIPVKKS